MSRLKFFIPVFIFIIIGVALWLAKPYDSNDMPSALIGRQLPNFSLPSLHDPSQQISNRDLLGDYALINVWGTWCVNCRYEHPFLMDLAAKGVSIFGLDWNEENYQAPRDWLKKYGDPYTATIADFDNQLGVRMGVYGAPETFLIDPDGVILQRHVGILDERVWVKNFLPFIQNGVSQIGE